MLIAASMLIVSCSQQDEPSKLTTAQKDPSAQPAGKYVAGQVIIKFKDNQSLKSRSNVMQSFGGVPLKTVYSSKLKGSDNGSVYLYSIKTSIDQAISKLNQMPEVEYAEPNFIYTLAAESNDPIFTKGNLWGMYGDNSNPSNKFGSEAAEAWASNHTGSYSVYVGIIDSGYMYNHEDLADNIWTNPGEIPKNGKDDDSNGYIDDYYGWNFNGNNSEIFDPGKDNHGTHVAGTIGAVGGNGIGVAGVCWKIKMINAKFLGRNESTTDMAISAIDYFIDLKSRYKLNLVAINNSWGGVEYSKALKEAIDRTATANILFVTAAGNGGFDRIGDNTDIDKFYPGSYDSPNIINVASINPDGSMRSSSNYGATSVDIGAPGTNIFSTISTSDGRSAYKLDSGTSMAAPHVTGAAALYASTNPGTTADQIKKAILNSAAATPSLSGKCVSGGRLKVSGF